MVRKMKHLSAFRIHFWKSKNWNLLSKIIIRIHFRKSKIRNHFRNSHIPHQKWPTQPDNSLQRVNFFTTVSSTKKANYKIRSKIVINILRYCNLWHIIYRWYPHHILLVHAILSLFFMAFHNHHSVLFKDKKEETEKGEIKSPLFCDCSLLLLTLTHSHTNMYLYLEKTAVDYDCWGVTSPWLKILLKHMLPSSSSLLCMWQWL